MPHPVYIAIDLKSFYASVECVERGLDPLETNLVVADKTRTDGTICLAVSPPLKARGIPGRPRLFEVVQKVSELNERRRIRSRADVLERSSCRDSDIRNDPLCAISYIVAPPRMALYLRYSARVYGVYLRYVAPEDIHVYSVDEVFIDATHYLSLHATTARGLAMRMIREVLRETGVTATAGIGPNLYLAKVAMDIVAKRSAPDADGVRIAELSERTYRERLWTHRPLSDFWRIGRGYERKLEENGLYTMGDIARCSLGRPGERRSEELLYRLFGVNAELLIDHAWGWEPTRIADIRAYRPSSSSVGSSQLLPRPYSREQARIVAAEMSDALAIELVDRGLVSDRLVLSIGYDAENLKDPAKLASYRGPVALDGYGRPVPLHARGTIRLPCPTAASSLICGRALELFDRIAAPSLLIRRISVCAGRAAPRPLFAGGAPDPQPDLFGKGGGVDPMRGEKLLREEKLQATVLALRRRFGKNALLRAVSLKEGATARLRNSQIGGHSA